MRSKKKGFADELQKAKGFIEKGAILPGNNPHFYKEAYTALMYLTDSPSAVKYLREGIRRNPLYSPYYQELNFFLAPRWNGKIGDQDQLMSEVLEKVPAPFNRIIYTQLLWSRKDQLSESTFRDYLRSGLFSMHEARSGVESLMTRMPQDRRSIHRAALFASYGQDKEWAREIFTAKILPHWEEHLQEIYEQDQGLRKFFTGVRDWALAQKKE